MRKALIKLKISGICMSPNVSTSVSCRLSENEGRRTFLNNKSNVNTNIPFVNRPIFVFVTGPSPEVPYVISQTDHSAFEVIYSIFTNVKQRRLIVCTNSHDLASDRIPY